jgi:hypothetical protein
MPYLKQESRKTFLFFYRTKSPTFDVFSLKPKQCQIALL